MTAQFHKPPVFMVINGNIEDGVPQVSHLVTRQAESLREIGWDVFLDVIDDRTSVQGILRNIRERQREVLRIKPGLIHAQYGSVTAAVARCIKGSLPLIVSFCGDDLLGTPCPGWQWRIRERGARLIGLWAAQHADTIIVKSHNLLQALPPNFRNRAIVLPNGIDTRLFYPMSQSECRKKLGWSQQSKVVLFNASNYENQYVKNPALAHATMALVSRSVSDVVLHMFSNTPPEEVPLLMNAADCLLVTSLQEGSPNIIKEAMACDLPVVSVPCGDAPERLYKCYPGAICPYDANALAEAILEVFRIGCRSNGREQLMMQKLDALSVAERLGEIYSCVLQKANFTHTSRTA